jgi:hypothetical protein
MNVRLGQPVSVDPDDFFVSSYRPSRSLLYVAQEPAAGILSAVITGGIA